MLLSDVLSKDETGIFEQVNDFLGNPGLKCGKQKKIQVGVVALTYFCKKCNSHLTFISGEELFCIGINERLISIDCVLKCSRCDELVPVWFLVESEEKLNSVAPKVRVLKRTEKLSENVLLSCDKHEDFAELLGKADQAYRNELGVGSVVYLRKIVEKIVEQAAIDSGIDTKITTKKGDRKRKDFKSLLEDVDKKCSIIPKEFSENGYKLFGELSDILHLNKGDEEHMGLNKYRAFRRLVIGVLDNVKNKREINEAVGTLGWKEDKGVKI